MASRRDEHKRKLSDQRSPDTPRPNKRRKRADIKPIEKENIPPVRLQGGVRTNRYYRRPTDRALIFNGGEFMPECAPDGAQIENAAAIVAEWAARTEAVSSLPNENSPNDRQVDTMNLECNEELGL